MPLTAFRFNPHNEITRLGPEHEKKLFLLFEEFLLPASKNYNKALILDFSVTGKSLFSATSYMEKYLQTKSSSVELSSLLMARSNGDGQYMLRTAREYKLKQKPMFLSLEHFHESERIMLESLTDEFAEYKAFNILKPQDILPKKNNTHVYRDFFSTMRSHLLLDSNENLAFYNSHLCQSVFVRIP
jgi:hypothetical protein